MSAAPGNDDPKPSRAPIVLSSFVMPGLGQFAQRRWVAGAAYTIGFVVPFALILVEAVRILSAFYGLGFDFDSAGVKEPVNLLGPMRRIVAWFVLASLAFVGNLADVYLAYRRACANWAQRKARLPNGPMT